MATITLNVSGSTVGDIASAVELSSADSDRLMAFLVAQYGVDDEGQPRTPQQMITAYWQGMVDGTLSNVTRWEQEQAAQVARDGVTPIAAVAS